MYAKETSKVLKNGIRCEERRPKELQKNLSGKNSRSRCWKKVSKKELEALRGANAGR